MGPYQTEREALAEPMPREVAALHDAGRVRSGDPDRLVRNTVLKHLHAACDEAGVKLGDYDRRILAGMAGRESATVQVVIGLVSRAAAPADGVDAMRERLLRHARDEHANGWDEASAYLYGAAACAADERVMAALWRAAEEFRTTARGIRDTADRVEEVSGD